MLQTATSSVEPAPGRRRMLSLLCGAAIASLPMAARAQAGNGDDYTPHVGQAGKDVVWVPTPDSLIDRMLRMAQVNAQDVVIDLGSGDGRIVIAAAKNFNAKSIGVEFNPDMVKLSRRSLQSQGVAANARIDQGDIFQYDLSQATVITMYLLPALNLRLRPRLLDLRPGTRLVTHAFTMGEWEPDEVSTVDGRDGHLWIVPANAGGTWRLQWQDGRSGADRGGSGADLEIDQTFQRLKGQVRFAAMRTTLRAPMLRGDRIQFELTDEQGTLRRFDGRVMGDRIRGTMTSSARAGGRTDVGGSFTATRNGEAPPIRTTSTGPTPGPAAVRSDDDPV